MGKSIDGRADWRLGRLLIGRFLVVFMDRFDE